MRNNIYIFIKVYYMSPILCFLRRIISRINTIKSRLILIILLYLKLVEGPGDNKNQFYFHNQLLQFLFHDQLLQFILLLYFCNQSLQFLLLILNFQTNWLLEYLMKCFKILIFVLLFHF